MANNAIWIRNGNVFTFGDDASIPHEITLTVPAGVPEDAYLDNVLGALNDDKERFVPFLKPKPADPKPDPTEGTPKQCLKSDGGCDGTGRKDGNYQANIPCPKCRRTWADGKTESTGIRT